MQLQHLHSWSPLLLQCMCVSVSEGSNRIRNVFNFLDRAWLTNLSCSPTLHQSGSRQAESTEADDTIDGGFTGQRLLFDISFSEALHYLSR